MKNKIPQRMCVSCRNMFPKNQLVRLVATESGVKVDGTGKMSGRGVYLCKNRQCIQRAAKNKGFEKAHGFAVTEQLQQELEKLIEK